MVATPIHVVFSAEPCTLALEANSLNGTKIKNTKFRGGYSIAELRTSRGLHLGGMDPRLTSGQLNCGGGLTRCGSVLC